MVYLAGAIALIFVLIAIGFLGGTVQSFHQAITLPETWSGNISTAIAETTGNLVLDRALYNSALSCVSSVTSSNGNDTPFVTAYDAGANALTIGGLVQSSNRVVTATYEYDNTAEYPSAKQVLQIGPTFVAICLIGLLIMIPVGLGILMYKRARG